MVFRKNAAFSLEKSCFVHRYKSCESNDPLASNYKTDMLLNLQVRQIC